MSANIVNVTDDTFEAEVLKAEGPVLVDYWAEWCGPCKMIAPVLEEVAEEYAGKLKVFKLNIDESEQTPPKFNIRGIPTLMLFKNGNVDASKVGALCKSQLSALLDINLYQQLKQARSRPSRFDRPQARMPLSPNPSQGRTCKRAGN